MNYKKSILSLATVIALSNTVLADGTATYLPLSSNTVDASWVLFGVNGFSDGQPVTAGAAASSSFTVGYTSIVEADETDNLATSGMSSAFGDVTGDLASVQEIGTIAALEVAVDITTDSIPFIPEEAVRTMYIKVSASTPEIQFNYKKSLEGRAIELLVDGTLYSTTISQDATWSNPATGTAAVAGAGSTAGAGLTDIESVLDFNMDNNPTVSSDYNATRHLDAAAGGAASFYHFNAITQQWEIWQKGSSTLANDFTDFDAGKAYWGRVDQDDNLANLDNDGTGTPVGLVLGQATPIAGIPNPDVYQDDSNVSTLAEEWNMLAFDDSKPYIRHAATGLVLTSVTTNSVIVITDDSGLHSITTANPVAVTAVGTANYALAINKQIESAKLRGELPSAFNVRAFSSEAGVLLLLSDTKFYVQDTDATDAVVVTTLDGANPYLDGAQAAVNDLNVDGATATAVESVYGEYAVMVDPLVGGTDADGDAGGFGYAMIKYDDLTTTATGVETKALTVGAATTAGVVAGFAAYTDAPTATLIDTNFDGTPNMVLVAHSDPFSLEDSTFVRVYDYTDAGAGDDYTIVGAASATQATTGGDSATEVAVDIDTAAVSTIRAHQDSAGKLVVFNTSVDTFDIKDVADPTLDYFSASSSTEDIAKGAISGVYSIDSVSRIELGQWTQTVPGFTTDAGSLGITGGADDTYQITSVTAGLDTTARAISTIPGVVGLVDTYDELALMYDEMVAQINAEIALTPGVHGHARHTYEVPGGVLGTDNLVAGTTYNDGDLIVSGVDIEELVIAFADAGALTTVGTQTATVETGDNLIDLTTGDLIADLKSNPVHSPNYAIRGPLYTLRNSGAGYNVRAMLKATTDMDTANGGATTTSEIVWDSIDITRTEDQWFANNEFNLFNVNHDAGYWVYLEENNTTTDITIATPTITKGYAYYFNNDAGLTTDNIINAGSLSVDITNLDDAAAGGTEQAASAYAIIKGQEIPLTRSSGDTFTADISNYTLENFSEGTDIDVKIRAVNGKGEATETTFSEAIDFTEPTNVTANIVSGSVILGVDGNTTENFYVFTDQIEENVADRVIFKTLSATGGNAASFDGCLEFSYGASTNQLRIVAADGAIDSSNLSAAVEITYANLLKGANILSHTGGVGFKSQLGDVYDTTCSLTTTQTDPTENVGVSLATLTAGQTTRISFQRLDNANFSQDVAWTSQYSVAAGALIVQIQNTAAYAGKDFFIEYNGAVYFDTFPATQAAADATVGTGNENAMAVITSITSF